MSGQTLNDRLTAAKHTLAGQGLARIVCKSTTEEVIGPKKKHLDHLLHCTNEPNVSIPQLANLLIERTQSSSWVVVFKALITVHHLMCYGNDRFTQYLASSNCTFQLGSFIDKCGVQGYDMSTFIRRYAKYLNEKAIAYRTVAFDFCKCKRGKEDGILRTMNIEKLLKTLPSLQNQLDALLEFDCSSNDLSNGVVNSCFMLLFRDLIRLFACYNDGIINLLEKYFEMNKKHARDSLDIYKKFLIRMDRVAEFLKVAENVGIDKGEIPDLTKAPSSLLEALESHLATLEGRKGSASAASGVPNDAFGSAEENIAGEQEINGVGVRENDDKAVEEDPEMNQLKFDKDSPLLWEQPAWEDSERRFKEVGITSPQSGSTKTNPFLASPSEPTSVQLGGERGIIDFFSEPKRTPNEEDTAVDNLLALNNNPFAESLFDGQETSTPASNQDFPSFETNGFSSNNAPMVTSFVSDDSFAVAFGDNVSSTKETDDVRSPIFDDTASEKSTVKLNLPVLDSFGGRSTSPSPTTDVMRGAGTTPILASIPDGAFGDATEPEETLSNATNQERTDCDWGVSAPTSGYPIPDPFGVPFEPTSLSAAATPTPTGGALPLSVHGSSDKAAKKTDFFELDSNDFINIGEQQQLPQPCAPPPSPFCGFDFTTFGSTSPDLRTQISASATDASHPNDISPQQPMIGFDNLNFSIQQSMQFTSGQAMSRNSPTSREPAALIPCNPMDNLGRTVDAPSVLGSSPQMYRIPSAGLPSPAKPSAGVHGFATGEFHAFGEKSLPSTPSNKSNSEKSGGSILKGDLDSTLASLASNLDILGPKQSLKKMSGHQWGSPRQLPKAAGMQPGWNGSNVAGGNILSKNWTSSPQHGHQQQVSAEGHVGLQMGTSKPMGSTELPKELSSGFTSATAPQSMAMPSQTASISDPFGAL